MTSGNKCHWGYKVTGLCMVAFGIWQGYLMRDQPDLCMFTTLAGIVGCYAMIAIGVHQEKL